MKAMGKYYYILGACEECWRGKDLGKAFIVFQDEQYDELFEVTTFLGIDIKEKLIAVRDEGKVITF